VPIFQEQVMQLAVVAAGFTPGEADQLRRAMAAWKRAAAWNHFEQRSSMACASAATGAVRAADLQQIQGFGEYGFPESHAASFALLVYASCWLKCHEPAAFTCALLNSQPMGFYAPQRSSCRTPSGMESTLRRVDVHAQRLGLHRARTSSPTTPTPGSRCAAIRSHCCASDSRRAAA
jgi:DNA polymerase III alpha subunit